MPMDPLSGLGGLGGSGGFSSSSSAKTGDLYEAPRTNYINPTVGGGGGNRGLVLNFAATGAKVSANEDINAPTSKAMNYVLYAVVSIAAVFAIVVLLRK